MQRLIFIFSLFILAIVGCSSNESHSFLIRPDGGGEDAATEIEVGKTIPAWQEGVMVFISSIRLPVKACL